MIGEPDDDSLTPHVAEFLAAWTDGAPPDVVSFCQGRGEVAEALRERLEDLIYVRSTLSSPPAAVLTFGHWHASRVLGEGGMGTVYLAEQREPIRRQAAIKVIRIGMDSGEVLARFEAERQALARMEHPHVARVLETGMTDDGRPFFAMEYVRGEPITDYCDSRRMPIDERLRLFVQVCRGVHHAHERGVVHRDIKPSNVLVSLVDDRAVPKLIDFGIAKALADGADRRAALTQAGRLLGTPEYMSPEQWAGETDLDARCDVYALGALLHELLAGVPPFDPASLRRSSWLEVHRFLMAQEPPLPSARLAAAPDAQALAARRAVSLPVLLRLLHRDLDWIVSMAMARERERRYATCAALAEDVERCLRHEPVRARRATIGYRVGRLARRHRGWLLAASGVAMALVAGFVVAGILADAAGPPFRLEPVFPIELPNPERDIGSLCGVGDVDNDRCPDLLVGSASDPKYGRNAGMARVFSGRDGRLIYELEGEMQDSDNFAHAVASVGDLDGDGVREILAGAYGNDEGGDQAGAAFLYSGKPGNSGKRGMLLHTWRGDQPGDHLGEAVSAAGDVDNDGVPDLLIGAPGDHQRTPEAPGCVLVVSGETYDPIWRIPGCTAGSKFGHAVSSLGDLDGDGYDDFVVGAPDEGAERQGALSVFSGKDRRELWRVTGEPEEQLGFIVRPIGDVDGDGKCDFAASGFVASDHLAGRVRLFSPAKRQQMGPLPGEAGHGFGRGLTGLGDINGDGRPEIAVGSWPEGRPGYVRVYCGLTLALLAEDRGRIPADKFGVVLADLIDGDGRPELAIGSPQKGGVFRVYVQRFVAGAPER